MSATARIPIKPVLSLRGRLSGVVASKEIFQNVSLKINKEA
jgi:hypothetical protein